MDNKLMDRLQGRITWHRENGSMGVDYALDRELSDEIKRLTSALESSRSDTILEMVRLSFPAGPGAPSAKERGRRIGLEEYREALRQKLFETQT